MLRKNLIIMVLILPLTAATAVRAEDKSSGREINRPDDKFPPNTTDIEMMLENLSHHVDLWHDAVLKGDEKNVRHYEQEIRWILGSDIAETQKAVRYYAETAVPEETEENPDQQAEGVENSKAIDKRALRQSRALLNTKALLSRSFARADAFSNKYRLVNDYIDLLRKQLDMPRPELASEKTVRRGYPADRARE